MSIPDDKENFAPLLSDRNWVQAQESSANKSNRIGRSKSIGPGGLEDVDRDDSSAKKNAKDAKNRRQSAFLPAVKSILPTKEEEAKRKAERRKSLANRRVSFAPEATLHTWDVIEYMRDHTTSTENSENTRRESGLNRTSPKRSTASSPGGGEQFSALLEQHDGGDITPRSARNRRSSGIPQIDYGDPEDVSSPGSYSSSSDINEEAESESEGDDGSEDGATGTVMSLDIEGPTEQSVGSASTTGSSARFEVALNEASSMAGTRGIAHDEFGEMSMDIASEEITNAFKPWVQRNENIDTTTQRQVSSPPSPSGQTHMISGLIQRPSTVQEEDEEDLTMDVTRVVGGILRNTKDLDTDVDEDDGTMEFTKAVGKVFKAPTPSSQKRRRSTNEAGSPGMQGESASKRRRSSVARKSYGGDETMDFTVAAGGIRIDMPARRVSRRQSVARRRSSTGASEADEATMDLTTAVGGIISNAVDTDQSFDEDFSMEITSAYGGIREVLGPVKEPQPSTPTKMSPSLPRQAVNTTPKEQERFRNADDDGSRRLLTPILQKQAQSSPEKHNDSAGRKSPIRTPKISPGMGNVQYPELQSVQRSLPSTKSLPHRSPGSRHDSSSKSNEKRRSQSQEPEPSPTALKQQRSSPVKVSTRSEQTPEHFTSQVMERHSYADGQRAKPQSHGHQQHQMSPHRDVSSLVDNIKLLNTPRKETLRSITPKKQTPTKDRTPRRTMTPKGTSAKKPTISLGSPARRLTRELEQLKTAESPGTKYHLQEFLDRAGVRFMDLTTTKRRMTTAMTPSKARISTDVSEENSKVTLESAVVAGTCTVPELEMFSHACRELKHYLSEGKVDIKQLEHDTYNETPVLIKAYMNADPDQRDAIDTQLRDIKTNARYRSKEMWYSWRSQLLEDLMKGLQGIGENLIKDDEVLERAESTIAQALSPLMQQHEKAIAEAEELERTVTATSDEERPQLDEVRGDLANVNAEVRNKRKILESLESQIIEQEQVVEHLKDVKTEYTEACKEADRTREACQGISFREISQLTDSVRDLEAKYGWKIISASSSPATITMTYKQSLELFFHPSAFSIKANSETAERPNSTISLFHHADAKSSHQQGHITILRFFLQLLRATLLGFPQYSTRISDMLSCVSSGWDTALELAEAERRLSLEGTTDVRIVDDGHLSISSILLLPKVKTKVKVAFELAVAIAIEDLDLNASVEPAAVVAYGEAYDEKKLTDFVNERIDGFGQWDAAIRELREKLVIQGPKGRRV